MTVSQFSGRSHRRQSKSGRLAVIRGTEFPKLVNLASGASHFASHTSGGGLGVQPDFSYSQV